MDMSKAIQMLSYNLKKPKTFEDQIELLKTRGVIINSDEEEAAKNYLKRVNYYYFTGYLLKYKNPDETYSPVEFKKIKDTILFDSKLKNLLLYCLENIEKSLKTNIAYYFAHNYEVGNIAYKYPFYFKDPQKHRILLEKIDENIEKNKELPYIKHNLDKYGELPIWVCIEVFTLGNLEHFYQLIERDIQNKIASVYSIPFNKLEKWLYSLRYLRNLVAHSQRIYGAILKTPVKPKGVTYQSDRIFDYILVIKELYLDSDDWNEYVVKSLSNLLDSYGSKIELESIGFPSDWENYISK